jgi:hypothetical protein
VIDRNALRLRLDSLGILRCIQPRRNKTNRPCETAIARSRQDVLVVRCRNCSSQHVFGIVDGEIRPLSTQPGNGERS